MGIAEYHDHVGLLPGVEGHIDRAKMAALGFEVMFGSLTITGSFMAFGKLQGFVPGPPITYRFQNQSNIGLFVLALLLFILLIFNPGAHAGVLPDGAGGPGRGRADRAADRRGRHAGGDFAVELLRRAWLRRPRASPSATTC